MNAGTDDLECALAPVVATAADVLPVFFCVRFDAFVVVVVVVGLATALLVVVVVVVVVGAADSAPFRVCRARGGANSAVPRIGVEVLDERPFAGGLDEGTAVCGG